MLPLRRRERTALLLLAVCLCQAQPPPPLPPVGPNATPCAGGSPFSLLVNVDDLGFWLLCVSYDPGFEAPADPFWVHACNQYSNGNSQQLFQWQSAGNGRSSLAVADGSYCLGAAAEAPPYPPLPPSPPPGT